MLVTTSDRAAVEQLLGDDDQAARRHEERLEELREFWNPSFDIVDVDGSVCAIRPRGCSKGARIARRKCQGPGRPRRQLGLMTELDAPIWGGFRGT